MTAGVIRRIVVATDFSDAAGQAWALARRLAAATGAELVLLHVVVEAPLYSETPLTRGRPESVYEAAERWARGELAKWAAEAEAAGARVRSRVRRGVAHEEILRVADEEDADLIVVGTRGLGRLERALLGSVADRLVRLAARPVVTVRQPA